MVFCLLMSVTLLDIILLLPVAYGLIKGATRGLVGELSAIAGLVGGLLAAFYFSEPAFQIIAPFFSSPGQGVRIAAFFLVFFTVVILINLVSKLLTKVLHLIALGTINRLFGALFGALKWLLITVVLVYFLLKIQSQTQIIKPAVLEQSLVFSYLQSFSQYLPELWKSAQSHPRPN
jgi:membrane protein required for colicin V production